MTIMRRQSKPTKEEVLKSGNVVDYNGLTCMVISKENGGYNFYGLVDLNTGYIINGVMMDDDFFKRFSINNFHYIDSNSLVIN